MYNSPLDKMYNFVSNVPLFREGGWIRVSGSPQHLELQGTATDGGEHADAPVDGVKAAMDRTRKGPSRTEYRRLRADLEKFFRQLGKAYSPGS